jgi:hypothetical protein
MRRNFSAVCVFSLSMCTLSIYLVLLVVYSSLHCMVGRSKDIFWCVVPNYRSIDRSHACMLVVRRSAVQQQPVLFLLTGEEVNSTARGCGYVHTVEIDAALADTRVALTPPCSISSAAATISGQRVFYVYAPLHYLASQIQHSREHGTLDMDRLDR